MKPISIQGKRVAGVAAVFFVLDQVSKVIVQRTLEPHQPYRGDVFFHFTHQRNEGLVGGSFSGVPFLPIVAPLFALALLIFMYRYLDRQSLIQHLAYGAAMGGALGNQLDRVRLHYVTDFLQFHFLFIPFDFPWKYYPAFNVADCGIVVGIIILAITWHNQTENDVSSTS